MPRLKAKRKRQITKTEKSREKEHQGEQAEPDLPEEGQDKQKKRERSNKDEQTIIEEQAAKKSRTDDTKSELLFMDQESIHKTKLEEEESKDVNNALVGLLSVRDRVPKNIKSKKKGSVKEKAQPGSVSHKSWTIIEEVFLVGVVVDVFLSRGSLSPKHYGESCWLLIKRNYDRAWTRYLEHLNDYKNGKLTQEQEKEFPFLKTMHHTTIDNHERTQGAMARHFKEMKDRCSKGTTINFSYYLREWDEIYNVNNCLLPPTENAKQAAGKDTGGIAKEESEKAKKESVYEGRWSHEDEVFLIAAVVNRFLKTGSLASPRGSTDQACWATIHRNFEWLQERAQSVSNNSKPKPKRTVTALLRRFKLIKEHQTKKSSIRALYNEWKEKYASDSLYSNFNHKDNKMSVSRNESSDKGGPPRPSKEATSTIDDSQVVQALKGGEGGKGKGLTDQRGNMLYLIDQAIDMGQNTTGSKAVNIDTSDDPPKVSIKAIGIERKEDEIRDQPANVTKENLDKMSKHLNKIKKHEKEFELEEIGGRLTKRENEDHSRVKWTGWDVTCLWNGIQTYGNGWSEIRKKFLPLRTTDQVKDKGKRMLRRAGWKTGRSKTSFSKASEEAKEIARTICAKRAIPRIETCEEEIQVNQV